MFVTVDKRGWVVMAEAPAEKGPVPSISREGNCDVHRATVHFFAVLDRLEAHEGTASHGMD